VIDSVRYVPASALGPGHLDVMARLAWRLGASALLLTQRRSLSWLGFEEPGLCVVKSSLVACFFAADVRGGKADHRVNHELSVASFAAGLERAQVAPCEALAVELDALPPKLQPALSERPLRNASPDLARLLSGAAGRGSPASTVGPPADDPPLLAAVSS
jgi:hypothetical protein